MDVILRDLSDCCGCGACLQVCPTKSVSLIEDEFGFKSAHVNSTTCIDCDKCRSVCPSLNPYDDDITPFCYSAYAKDIKKRTSGSSGGIFSLLAEYVLIQGGFVYGAAFDESLRLRHIEVSRIEDLYKVLKSKYLQSELGGIFTQVRTRLKQNKIVLFCGTPCQCLSLYCFLGRTKPQNLILVDFICHGVPSQRLFDKAIESWENSNGCRIKEFSFRTKSSKASTEAGLRFWTLKSSNNKMISGPYTKFPFYHGYLKYLFFRPSCYKCSYAKISRCTDITLGDFWGLYRIENIPIKEFNKGYSMILVNSYKGYDIINKLDVIKREYSLEIAISNNYAYTHPTSQTNESVAFFKDYSNMSWTSLEKKYLIFKGDIFHRCVNFMKRKWRSLLNDIK